ncbi:MAG: fimbrillin family protein [Bacteroidales bacterium]|nr:fimbrillin family protein [Bacteroidales bacterium]
MKYRLILILPILLAAASCGKDRHGSAYADSEINFSGAPVTRAFLEADGLDVFGTQVKVYDWLTGFTGIIDGTSYVSSDYLKYVDDAVVYDSGAYWPYTTASNEYRWTRTGTHRFFGWLILDKAYNSGVGLSTYDFFGGNPTLDEDPTSPTFLTMTTPVYSFQSSSPQYDFVYSKSATVRNAASKDYSYVQLPMKHMFTAVSLCFTNASTNTNVQITDLNTLYEGDDIFLHKGYATVDFSSDANNITPVYHLEGDTSHPFFNASAMSGITVVPDKTYDLLTGTDVTTAQGISGETYYMTWPLTKDQISPQDILDYDIFGDPIYHPHDKILALTYRANGGAPETVRVQFPYRDWKAGTRMRCNIEFTDKSIQMIEEVLPWDYNEQTMDFNGESLVVPDGGKVSIENMESLQDNATLYLTTETPEITCKVFISSLKGATLVITMQGDNEYFVVEPSTMTITGDRMYFVVKPSSVPTGGVERQITLSYSVDLPSGRELDGNSEIRGNDHNYVFSRR